MEQYLFSYKSVFTLTKNRKDYMFRKLLLLFVVCCEILYAEDSKSRKFDIAISLGEVCQTAGNLSANGLRLQSFPLDWLVTPSEGLIKFIAYEGYNFINVENLLFNVFTFAGSGGVCDIYYGIFFYHDFLYSLKRNPQGNLIGIKKLAGVELKNYAEVKAKFDRRIARFFEVLHSDKKVLLVRLGMSYQDAILLNDLLHNKYPHLDYLLVVLDNTEEIKTDWGLERVKNFYIERQSTFGTNMEDWKNILSQFEFNPYEFVNTL